MPLTRAVYARRSCAPALVDWTSRLVRSTSRPSTRCGARPPEGEPGRGDLLRSQAGEEALPLLQEDPVDVDRVVPVVERRRDRARQRRQRMGERARVVVRLVRCRAAAGRAGGQVGERGLRRRAVPSRCSASRPGGHCVQPFAALASAALRSSSHETWSGVSSGPGRGERRRGRDLRRRERRADRVAELGRAAVRVGPVGAPAVDEALRDRREDVVAGRGEVDEDRRRDSSTRAPSRPGGSRDADHVRQRRRVVGVRPRRRSATAGRSRPRRRRPRPSRTRSRWRPARAASRCRGSS